MLLFERHQSTSRSLNEVSDMLVDISQKTTSILNINLIGNMFVDEQSFTKKYVH